MLVLALGGLVALRFRRDPAESFGTRLSAFAVVPLLAMGSLTATTPEECVTDTSTTTVPATTTTVPATTTTVPVSDMTLCTAALPAWVETITDYATVSANNTPLEVVDIYEARAQEELAVCAGLTLVQNGTADAPNAGPLLGVGYSFTGTEAGCTPGDCDGGNDGELLGDGGDGALGGDGGAGGAGVAGTNGFAGSNGGDGGDGRSIGANGIPGDPGQPGGGSSG